MKKILNTIGFALLLVLVACNKPSSIKVENKLPKVVLKNIQWGSMPITTQLLPGETSNAISVYDNSSYYDVSLPAKFPLKFYMELNGDKVYLQTRESYNLGKEEDITITIDDTTKVYNPLFP